MAHSSVGEVEQELEREYIALRASVLGMLKLQFSGVEDREEIYQEAWAEALELRARGEEIRDLRMLLRTIAWRRGRDRVRNFAPYLTEPDSHELVDRADPAAAPDEQVPLQIDGAVIRHIVDSLEPREAAVLKLRYQHEFEPEEIQQALGMSEALVEKLTTLAYQHVAEVLTESAPGVSEWRRRQRSLFLACETGVASAAQRLRAQRLLREDPVSRAMLLEIRETLQGVAALLPVPALVGQRHGVLAGAWSWIGQRLAWLRDQVADAVDRLGRHGPSVEQAGASGAASAAGGVAVKAAIVCVAVTGGTVACVTSGVFGGSSDDRRHQPPPPRVSHQAPERPPRHPSRLPRLTIAKQPARHTAERVAATQKVQPVAEAPPPSPAPAGSTEFGPGTVGSTGATATPAAAPSGGGGEFSP